MSEPIKGNCIFCGGEITFREEDVGRMVECPHCRRSMEVEGATEGDVELSKGEAQAGEPREAGTAYAGSGRKGRWVVAVVCLVVFAVIGVIAGLMVAQRD